MWATRTAKQIVRENKKENQVNIEMLEYSSYINTYI